MAYEWIKVEVITPNKPEIYQLSEILSIDPDSVLGIIRNGDLITIDVEKRILSVDLTDEEIAQRIQERKKTLAASEGAAAPWVKREGMRGYRGLYMRHVNQAEAGADFDFLTADGPPRS